MKVCMIYGDACEHFGYLAVQETQGRIVRLARRKVVSLSMPMVGEDDTASLDYEHVCLRVDAIYTNTGLEKAVIVETLHPVIELPDFTWSDNGTWFKGEVAKRVARRHGCNAVLKHTPEQWWHGLAHTRPDLVPEMERRLQHVLKGGDLEDDLVMFMNGMVIMDMTKKDVLRVCRRAIDLRSNT